MLPVKCAIPTVRYDVCCVVLIVMQQFNTLRVYKKATCVLKCVIDKPSYVVFHLNADQGLLCPV